MRDIHTSTSNNDRDVLVPIAVRDGWSGSWTAFLSSSSNNGSDAFLCRLGRRSWCDGAASTAGLAVLTVLVVAAWSSAIATTCSQGGVV